MIDIVFIDVLVLENFLMNYLLLYIINRFCRFKAKQYRLSLAALIGAMYVVLIFFPDFSFLYSAIMKFMMSMVMIAVAFTPYKIKEFIKVLILFYVEAFLLGGSILALFYLTNRDIDFSNGAFLISNITSGYVIAGSLIAIVLVKLGFDYFENYYRSERNRVEIQVILDKKQCSITALIDTGNSLRDPMTNVPVIIVYLKAIADILPDELKGYVERNCDYEFITNKIITSSLKSRIRVIPFRALGTENGLLTGIRVDMVIVKLKSKYNIIKEPIIALYNKPISNQGEYQALAYPEILK